MKRAQLIGITIAGGAGLLAFILMRSIVSGPPPPRKSPFPSTRPRSSSRAATFSSAKSPRTPTSAGRPGRPMPSRRPSSRRPDGDEGMKRVTDAIARAPLLEGEPVTRQKLIKPGQGGVLAAILPSGMRAISTRIKEETAAGRLILPNDRVDVILTRRVNEPGRPGRLHRRHACSPMCGSSPSARRSAPRKASKSTEGAATTATLELTPAASGVAGARQFVRRDQPVAAQRRRRRPERRRARRRP